MGTIKLNKMKESTILKTIKKVESLTRLVEYLLNEMQQTKQIAVGTLELVKMMPQYNEALESLKNKNLEEIKKRKEDAE